MAETKVYYHGTTVVNEAGPANPPPPYTEPGVYPHPPGPYQQPVQQQPYGATVVQATVVPGAIPILITQQMGPNPSRLTCKSCNCEIVTRVETRPTMRTHLFAAILCLFGCWPCVCLPYCMDSCLNTDHYCPNCNSYVGSYVA